MAVWAHCSGIQNACELLRSARSASAGDTDEKVSSKQSGDGVDPDGLDH